MNGDALRVVTCALDFAVAEQAQLVFQIVPASSSGSIASEMLDISCDGAVLDSVEEIAGPHSTRVHVVASPPGRLKVTYRGEVDVGTTVASAHSGVGAILHELNPTPQFAEVLYLRPSRYCPTDRLGGFATAEFGTSGPVTERVAVIVEWIRRRIEYLPGSGTVRDSAEDTLLTGMGTCRDFAHLGVALCRAVGIPARFSGVYAPGLSPMDFHAVFEILHDGHWYVFDPTGLAPRGAMVRIATGRDAADVAFASVERGSVELIEMEVSAVVGSSLPIDDLALLVQLA